MTFRCAECGNCFEATEADVRVCFKCLPHDVIAGMHYFPNWISEEQEQVILGAIDSMPWEQPYPERGPNRRRVQQYGDYRYNFEGKGVLPLGVQAPTMLAAIGLVLMEIPNQVIVNEYLPKQGISPHTDTDMNCSWVSTLSLGSCIMMHFKELNGGGREKLYLESRSLLTLSGPAFFDWKHGIHGKAADLVGEMLIPRTRRVSVTFRHIKS